MNAELAIQKILSDDAAFTALCTGGVHYDTAPQTTAAPYCLVSEDSIDPGDDKDGPSDYMTAFLSVRHYAPTRNTVAAMAKRAWQVLDRHAAGTFNGVQIDSVQFISQRTDVEENVDALKHEKDQTYKCLVRP